MYRYIEEEDLLRFMIKEEVDLFFPLIEGSDTGKIYRKALINWAVRCIVYLVLEAEIRQPSPCYITVTCCHLSCAGEGLSRSKGTRTCPE